MPSGFNSVYDVSFTIFSLDKIILASNGFGRRYQLGASDMSTSLYDNSSTESANDLDHNRDRHSVLPISVAVDCDSLLEQILYSYLEVHGAVEGAVRDVRPNTPVTCGDHHEQASSLPVQI